MQHNNKAMHLLEITVNNHAGVMSHIINLFSRRSYNLEGIFCLPVYNKEYKGEISKIWLMLNRNVRIDQVIKQAEKLEDVIYVKNIDSEFRFPKISDISSLLESNIYSS